MAFTFISDVEKARRVHEFAQAVKEQASRERSDGSHLAAASVLAKLEGSKTGELTKVERVVIRHALRAASMIRVGGRDARGCWDGQRFSMRIFNALREVIHKWAESLQASPR